ncbi:hypothetical protein BRADI_1g21461v3 [Brachypodium distachyon]|uniref:Uncharacterized protein n=1 Tax=Brachypodium distachyon TaxID=15368 RepID=A0A2K2DKG3_BRADI|nr:hypothetical protein BRADI_1g21461v3 [Brachypodium distachyon]
MCARRAFEEMPKQTNSPPRRYNVWYCDYCGRRGHLKDFCWNLSGTSLKYSNHFRCGSDSAHDYVVSKGESHTAKVQMTR